MILADYSQLLIDLCDGFSDHNECVIHLYAQ